jgi:hypothetical protein
MTYVIWVENKMSLHLGYLLVGRSGRQTVVCIYYNREYSFLSSLPLIRRVMRPTKINNLLEALQFFL